MANSSHTKSETHPPLDGHGGHILQHNILHLAVGTEGTMISGAGTPSASPCESRPGPTTRLVPPGCCYPLSGLGQPKKASNLMSPQGLPFWGSLTGSWSCPWVPTTGVKG